MTRIGSSNITSDRIGNPVQGDNLDTRVFQGTLKLSLEGGKVQPKIHGMIGSDQIHELTC